MKNKMNIFPFFLSDLGIKMPRLRHEKEASFFCRVIFGRKSRECKIGWGLLTPRKKKQPYYGQDFRLLGQERELKGGEEFLTNIFSRITKGALL